MKDISSLRLMKPILFFWRKASLARFLSERQNSTCDTILQTSCVSGMEQLQPNRSAPKLPCASQKLLEEQQVQRRELVALGIGNSHKCICQVAQGGCGWQ